MGVIDLSDLSVQVAPLEESLISEHIGGAAVNRILLDRYDGNDSIVLGTGPLTGSFAPASCLLVATFRSPLSGKISNVPLTIRTGSEMKFAGFDFLVMNNTASQPMILSVHEGTMVFHPAGPLLNLTIAEMSSIMRREIRDIRSWIIAGPAADKRAVSASVSVSRGGSFDKTGLASVMASKNIKGVLFNGIDGLSYGDNDLTRSEAMMKGLSTSLHGKGPGFSRILQHLGADSSIMELLPIKKMRQRACYHCPFPCMCHVEVTNETLFDGKDSNGIRTLLLTDHLGFMTLADTFNADVFPIMAACNEWGLDPVAVSQIIPRGGSLDEVLSMIKGLFSGPELKVKEVDGHTCGTASCSIPRQEADRFGGGIPPLTVIGDFDSPENWKRRVALSMILGICPIFLLMFPAITDVDLLSFIDPEKESRDSLQIRLQAVIDDVCRA